MIHEGDLCRATQCPEKDAAPSELSGDKGQEWPLGRCLQAGVLLRGKLALGCWMAHNDLCTQDV